MKEQYIISAAKSCTYSGLLFLVDPRKLIFSANIDKAIVFDKENAVKAKKYVSKFYSDIEVTTKSKFYEEIIKNIIE